jgi:pimeloyl-ACP methyl ester carboxylesterase
VLFECLSGVRAFGGATAGDRIAAVLGGEPDWSAIPEDVPDSIGRLLRRCLRKDRARRIHSVADVRIELEDALAGEPPEGGRTGRGARGGAPIERHFRLTAEICRLLDREALDPEMIGGNLLYLDNGRVSPIVVCHIPGLGLDHRIFEETLVLPPYRCLAPTFYGCEPVSARRIDIPFGDQLVLLREFLADATRRLRPQLLILVGFSLGADIAFRLLSEPRGEPPRVDGILSLGCNLSLETCVFSARLADLTRTSSEAMVPALRAMGASVSSVAEWIQIHRHLVEVVAKYLDDFEVLRTDPRRPWHRFAIPIGTRSRSGSATPRRRV